MRTAHALCFLILSTACLFGSHAVAQPKFFQADTSVKVYAYGKELTMAWSGGFNSPQFAMGDLNHDGLSDLVVFENYYGVRTFINHGTAGNPNYRYEPAYALNFPPIFNYLILADYNCDNIPDLYQRGYNGFSVYRGYYNWANQLCFAYYKDLFYTNSTSSGIPINAYCNPGDVPAIVDIDGDGDLDYVAYDISGGWINLYKDQRVEKGLPCDSIMVALKDRCWGKVYQGFFRTHSLQRTCDNSGLHKDAPAGKVTHSGNTLCLFDWDMDGDYDYLDGSVSFNEMTFLKNGRVENSYPIDSMVSQDTTWQSDGHPIEIPTWPVAFNIDVDQDGKKDLLISPNAGNSAENYKCIWFYKNNSTPGVPNWQFQSDSFITDKTIDLGTASYPTLFDYNKDGKPDLFVGSDGYYQSATGVLLSKMSCYLNTSVTGSPSLNLSDNNFLHLDTFGFKGAVPAFGDIDGDGLSDMVIGHTNGTLSYFKNMAASESVQPDWQINQLLLTDMNGDTIFVDGYAAPFIYDMDKDGKPDLIIGSTWGTVQYYRNVSDTPGNIKLQLVNTNLGGVTADANQSIGNYSIPFIGKVDNSGTDYLLLGSNSGNVYRYTGFQSGDTTAVYTMLDSQFAFIDSTYNLYAHPGKAYGLYNGLRSSLTTGDIDGSGNLYMITGNVKGGLQLFRYKKAVSVSEVTQASGRVNVYPNPTSDQLNVSWANIMGDEVTVNMVNMQGQVVSSARAVAHDQHTVISTASLPVGIYICALSAGGNVYYNKVTVIR